MFVARLAAVISTVAAVASPRSGGDNVDSPADVGDVADKFVAFIQSHGRTYTVGSEEYHTRLQHFRERLEAIDVQNSQPNRVWTAAINHLADRTPAELAMLRGYRHSPNGRSETGSLGLAATSVREVNLNALPANFTWGDHLLAMKHVRNQGACGSCWAISSATVLRAHAELYQTDRTFSTQQILECTANPNECGGKGGCEGATAELAMEFAVTAGLPTEEEHTYLARDGKCASSMLQPLKKSLRSIAKHGVSLPQVGMQGQGGASFGMTGWKRLPQNKLAPLLEAVYNTGPVVISVAATSDWSMYSSGVLPACEPDAVINHAVVLVGYGPGYWHIQNSWGSGWGEGGFVRLFRHSNQDEEQYCGVDKDPAAGTGCKGGPKEVTVCGTCGILYDNVIPLFEKSEHGFLSRYNRDAAGIFVQLDASDRHFQQ